MAEQKRLRASGKSDEQVLQEMSDWFQSPERWIQGDYGTEMDGELLDACMMGAMYQSLYRNYNADSFPRSGRGIARENRLRRLLAKVIVEQFPDYETEVDDVEIIDFNDDPERTWEHVAMVVEKTLTRVREGTGG